MDKHTFEILYEDALRALKEKRLSDALNALDGLVAYNGSWRCKIDLVDIRDAYGMLLDYMSRGFVDPDRDQMLQQFLRQAYEVADGTYRDFLIGEGDSHYASVWNIMKKTSQPLSLLDICEKGGSYRQLFEVAWTSPIWNKSEYEMAHEIMESADWSESDCCGLVSGVTLSTLKVFDALRLRFLQDIAVSPVPAYRVRALVGVVLIYVKYSERCQYYPELVAQLKLMSDLPGFVAMLQTLQMQLFLSLETKKIEKSLREEILPQVMKKAKDIRMDKSLGFDELQDKLNEQDFNPEWDKDGKVSELSAKMKELAEMQLKGADVYMGSFKMFKQRFPFFNVAANWFCPFSFENPELKTTQNSSYLAPFLESGNLCDSDKYSFCLMLQEMPMAQTDMLRQQLDATVEEHSEVFQKINEDDEKKTIRLMRSYVQDLYRFFTLFRYREPSENPFGMNLLLTDYVPFAEILSSQNVLQDLADFTFKEKSFLYALKFYERLPESAENCQKIGFCHQSVKDYYQAIQAYEKANLLKANSVWTLRQLGNCYRSVGKFKEALRVYEELETLVPEDISLLLRLSECYLHEEMYDKAFEKLYKADYLSPESGKAVRALAWCSLLTGKIEQANEYYAKILAAQPSREDYFNAGHAAWLQGDVPLAVSRYRQTLSMDKKDFAPNDFFGDDARVLKEKGKTDLDLRLMVDVLNFSKR